MASFNRHSLKRTVTANAYAGFSSRLFAYVIDTFVLLLSVFLISYFATSFAKANFLQANYFSVLSVLVSFAYFTYFIGRHGQTIGKYFFRIKVVDIEGEIIGYKKAAMRWLGYAVSRITLGIGFLWVVIDQNKQGFHDKIAKTYVIKAW